MNKPIQVPTPNLPDNGPPKPLDEPVPLNELRLIESGLLIPEFNTVQRICYQLRKLMGDPHPESQ